MQLSYSQSIQLIFTIALLTLCQSLVLSQKHTPEIVIGAGVSYFMGDLGGSRDVGSIGPKDLDIPAFRWLLQGGIRKPISHYFTLRGNLAGGYLSGNDDFSKNDVRYDRGLSFRAPFIELSAICEFYFIKERYSGIYKVNSKNSAMKSNPFNR